MKNYSVFTTSLDIFKNYFKIEKITHTINKVIKFNSIFFKVCLKIPSFYTFKLLYVFRKRKSNFAFR